MSRFSVRTLRTVALLVALVAGASQAHAQAGEDLAAPTFRKMNKGQMGANLLQFKVKEGNVHSIAVEVKTYAKNGRVDTQLFQLTGGDDRGAFPSTPGYRMWESDKIFAALDQWKDRGQVDRVEFTYVVHEIKADQQRVARPSSGMYAFAGRNEWNSDGAPARIAANPGRKLDAQDPREVQAAVDHLAKHPPAGTYKTLPGFYPHPLHGENDIAKALERVIKAKRQSPGRRLFIKWTLYNQDSERLANLLAEAKRVGVEVEGLADHSQVTPRLAGKPAHEIVRNAGIPVTNLVRNGASGGDIRTNHTKVWILGERDAQNKIVNGTVFDCSFNTEFRNYPGNQEAMTTFANNKYVATVYNHMFEAMKGNAPLRLTLEPKKAKFIANHPLFPYVDRTTGQLFTARDALNLFLDKPKKSLTLLDFVVYDRPLGDKVAATARRGVKVHSFHNGWKARNEDSSNLHVIRNGGGNVHLVFSSNGSSPVHHKEGEADGKWARGGSLNMGDWSFQSDESMYVIRSGKIAKQIRAQSNRLAYAGYGLDNLRGSAQPEKLMQKVQFEVRVPKSINPAEIAGVYFAGGGSQELSGSWVKLDAAKEQPASGKQNIFRGSRKLPQGFNHNGRAVIKLRDGRELWSVRKDGQANETFFTVDPRSSGRQRITMGGFKTGR